MSLKAMSPAHQARYNDGPSNDGTLSTKGATSHARSERGLLWECQLEQGV